MTNTGNNSAKITASTKLLSFAHAYVGIILRAYLIFLTAIITILPVVVWILTPPDPAFIDVVAKLDMLDVSLLDNFRKEQYLLTYPLVLFIFLLMFNFELRKCEKYPRIKVDGNNSSLLQDIKIKYWRFELWAVIIVCTINIVFSVFQLYQIQGAFAR